ncbi:MAG: hypothetical protein IJ583_16650 [Firmicutes bacterium]|nr:hypothetical protein [Bacillota bacterium]
MKFKRIAALTMTGALLGSLCTGAFADENVVKSTQLKLMIAEPDTSYVLSIPANMDTVQSGWNDLGGVTVKNENKTFSEKKKVKVTASSENNWNLKLDDTNKISYELKASEEAAETVNEWEFTAADLNKDNGETKNIGIKVAEYDDNAEPGNYTDTITFTASVENAAYTPQTYTSLSTGDVLHVGDMLVVSNSDVLFDGWCLLKDHTYTLVRANVIDSFDGAEFTESPTGEYYVFKNENNAYIPSYMETLNKLKVTNTSDGIVYNGAYADPTTHES